MITRKPVVLVAPLDWGFGHTTRCIPIIRHLLTRGCEVVVACNSTQKKLLSQELLSIRYLELPGYNIRYGKTGVQTILRLILQMPKILIKITGERSWLKSTLRQIQVDAIISDNRYGFCVDSVPSIFITHQLAVRSGLGKFVDSLIQKAIYRYIHRFKLCWIPDWADAGSSVAGHLSHPAHLPGIPVKYIGCLSRFDICNSSLIRNSLLILLSGPEPQRSILEKIIIEQLKDFPDNAVVVRGVFDRGTVNSSGNILVLNYASSNELNRLICDSQIILCRAGYTTIMDLLKLRKQVILVPTPGQAEQEYLGAYLHQKRLAYTIGQENFHLKTAFENAQQLTAFHSAESMQQYKAAIEDLVNSLDKNKINHHAQT